MEVQAGRAASEVHEPDRRASVRSDVANARVKILAENRRVAHTDELVPTLQDLMLGRCAAWHERCYEHASRRLRVRLEHDAHRLRQLDDNVITHVFRVGEIGGLCLCLSRSFLIGLVIAIHHAILRVSWPSHWDFIIRDPHHEVTQPIVETAAIAVQARSLATKDRELDCGGIGRGGVCDVPATRLVVLPLDNCALHADELVIDPKPPMLGARAALVKRRDGHAGD
mmetsp:Transcript_69249/g.192846  ORF Transcript_69249/g.192846 Transcript_69249/m.192846 type:complete len:226 (-) Transcript_69249:1786-2463(-)